MSQDFSIFIVDDAEANRRMIELAFGKFYDIESFESGASCLARVEEKIPKLFLLDVDMPEMDGYALCRQLKSLPDSKNIPIIFISGLDDLESRLTGYDAGGDDFIVKPYKVAELKQKIEVLRRIHLEKSALQNRLEESDTLTSLVLSNLDEYAILVNFLRALNTCEQPSNVAEAILEMLRSYQLQGALQFRLPKSDMTITHAGEASPLQASIINHVRTQGAIAEFKNRAAFNFGLVSVLVNNMPIHDPDLCGRLRDHLAIAVETVSAKIKAVLANSENLHTKREIVGMLHTLEMTVAEFSKKYEKARFLGSETTRKMLNDLDAEFASLGMSEEQEEVVASIIRARTDQLIQIFDFGAETENTLKDLSAQLGGVMPS